jgi:archaellum component FlaG (FlaF/FlaG flagellin family)
MLKSPGNKREFVGISEIVATVLLVLIVTSIMTTIYIAYNRSMNLQSHRIEIELERINEENAGLDLVDYYYIRDNSTLTLCLFLRSDIVVKLDSAYIDDEMVPNNNLLLGFGDALEPGVVNCVRIVYSLSSGAHSILLVTEEGARFEYTITIS